MAQEQKLSESEGDDIHVDRLCVLQSRASSIGRVQNPCMSNPFISSALEANLNVCMCGC